MDRPDFVKVQADAADALQAALDSWTSSGDSLQVLVEKELGASGITLIWARMFLDESARLLFGRADWKQLLEKEGTDVTRKACEGAIRLARRKPA